MRKVLLVISLFITVIAFSQDTPQTGAGDYLDSIKNIQANKEVKQGIDNLVRYQNEQRTKQKKQAFLYIGIGVFFLIILIVGLRRKVKK